MVSNFVVVDHTSDNVDVFFYEERVQGKDADALCNLRFMYHFKDDVWAQASDAQDLGGHPRQLCRAE